MVRAGNSVTGTDLKTSQMAVRVGDRLERSAAGFDWMTGSPHFREIRIDEQVRCYLLKERIDQWLGGRREVHHAAKIWTGVVAFVGYLTEINHRSELLSFDQQLLVWAIDEIQRSGLSPSIFERVDALYGRDPGLDTLLDEPDGVSRAAWTAHLRRVLTESRNERRPGRCPGWRTPGLRNHFPGGNGLRDGEPGICDTPYEFGGENGRPDY